MNLRILPALACLLALFVSLPAMPVRAAEIRLAPGRALHGFAFAPPGDPGAMTGGNPGSLMAGVAGAEGWLQIDFGIDVNQPFLLLDLASGESLLIDPQGATLLDRRTASFSEGWQFFLVPAARAGHAFMVSQGPSFAIASVANAGVFNVAGVDYVELRAPNAVGAEAFLVDLTDFTRSPAGLTWLAPEVWQPYTGPMPLVNVVFYLGPEQSGQTFTLHQRAFGGNEHCQQLSGWAAVGGDYLVGADWQGFAVASGALGFNSAVGYGMEFWLTRDADGAACASCWHTGQGFAGFAPAVWNFQSAFGQPPAHVPDWQVVNFRLPADGGNYSGTDPGHYVVRQADGTEIALLIGGSDYLWSYPDFRNSPRFLPVFALRRRGKP